MGWIVLGVVAIIIIALVGFVITTYNNLILAKNNVKNSFAQIDTQLQRRFDLIPNLVETVKGYATHEKELLEKVAASRNGYMNATSGEQKLAMNQQLTAGLKSIFAIVENYPELKANSHFLEMQEELSETEDKVAFARQFYNDAVTIYNNKIQLFPNNLVANMFGFKEEALFTSDDETRETPKIQF